MFIFWCSCSPSSSQATVKQIQSNFSHCFQFSECPTKTPPPHFVKYNDKHGTAQQIMQFGFSPNAMKTEDRKRRWGTSETNFSITFAQLRLTEHGVKSLWIDGKVEMNSPWPQATEGGEGGGEASAGLKTSMHHSWSRPGLIKLRPVLRYLYWNDVTLRRRQGATSAAFGN